MSASELPSRSQAKFKWLVEYEIPPLRAIYLAECDAKTEADVRVEIARDYPEWRIRKITPNAPPPERGS